MFCWLHVVNITEYSICNMGKLLRGNANMLKAPHCGPKGPNSCSEVFINAARAQLSPSERTESLK